MCLTINGGLESVLVPPYIFSRTMPFTLDILVFTCTFARQKDFENVLNKDSSA